MSTIKAEKLQSLGSKLNFLTGATPTQRLTIDENGNVGIGTATPTLALQVVGSIAAVGGAVDYPVSVNSNAIFVGGAGTPDSGRIIIGDNSGWKYKISNRINSITTDLVTFDDRGMVGIGFTSPDSPLHVLGAQNYGGVANSGIVTIGNANNSRQINLGVSDTNSAVYIEGWIPGTGSSNLVLQPTEGGGKVGIGVAAPTQTLDVAGSIKASTSLVLGSATMEAPSGTAPIFGARAYGYIPSTLATGTKPPYSENVASITRVSINITKVTFITPMPHAFYTVVGMSRYIPTFANQPQIFISPAYLTAAAIQPNTTTEMYFTVWDNNANDGQALGYNNISETSFVIYC